MNKLVSSEYISEKEVANHLSISIKKLQRDRYAGIGIPYFKFGKVVRYKKSDVLTWIEQNMVTTQ